MSVGNAAYVRVLLGDILHSALERVATGIHVKLESLDPLALLSQFVEPLLAPPSGNDCWLRR